MPRLVRSSGLVILCLAFSANGMGCIYSPPLYQKPPGFSSSYHRYLLEQQRVRMQAAAAAPLPLEASGSTAMTKSQ